MLKNYSPNSFEKTDKSKPAGVRRATEEYNNGEGGNKGDAVGTGGNSRDMDNEGCKGGCENAENMNSGNNCVEEDDACDKTIRLAFDVNVPVSVKPCACVGKAEAKCEGGVKVCPGNKCCECRDDDDDDTFDFTITQKILVFVPVKYGAVICHGETCAEDETDL
ncbi:MAG: hypothetical protein FWC55_09445 [Firmicutes bacterium]|nr:hypothetical protein [Bacillota bacterium]